MKENFEAFMPHLLKSEGGWVNHPADPGGATNKGITIGTFRNFCRIEGRKPPTLDQLKNISPEDVKRIYDWQYWDKIWGDDLPAGLDVAVFDFAVNSGPSQAIKVLQRVVKTRVDGDMGANTLAAIEKAMAFDEEATINAYMDRRLAFLKALKTWPTFGRGWSRRVADVRKRALAMAAGDAEYGGDEIEARRTEKADPDTVGIMKTRAGKAVAAIVAGGVGTAGAEGGPALLEHAETVRGFADYLPWLGIVAGIIAVAGVAWLVFDLFMKRREGSLT
jgi:lysozyme family protein